MNPRDRYREIVDQLEREIPGLQSNVPPTRTMADELLEFTPPQWVENMAVQVGEDIDETQNWTFEPLPANGAEQSFWQRVAWARKRITEDWVAQNPGKEYAPDVHLFVDVHVYLRSEKHVVDLLDIIRQSEHIAMKWGETKRGYGWWIRRITLAFRAPEKVCGFERDLGRLMNACTNLRAVVDLMWWPEDYPSANLILTPTAQIFNMGMTQALDLTIGPNPYNTASQMQAPFRVHKLTVLRLTRNEPMSSYVAGLLLGHLGELMSVSICLRADHRDDQPMRTRSIMATFQPVLNQAGEHRIEIPNLEDLILLDSTGLEIQNMVDTWQMARLRRCAIELYALDAPSANAIDEFCAQYHSQLKSLALSTIRGSMFPAGPQEPEASRVLAHLSTIERFACTQEWKWNGGEPINCSQLHTVSIVTENEPRINDALQMLSVRTNFPGLRTIRVCDVRLDANGLVQDNNNSPNTAPLVKACTELGIRVETLNGFWLDVIPALSGETGIETNGEDDSSDTEKEITSLDPPQPDGDMSSNPVPPYEDMSSSPIQPYENLSSSPLQPYEDMSSDPVQPYGDMETDRAELDEGDDFWSEDFPSSQSYHTYDPLFSDPPSGTQQ